MPGLYSTLNVKIFAMSHISCSWQAFSILSKNDLNEWKGLPLDMHLINSYAIMG